MFAACAGFGAFSKIPNAIVFPVGFANRSFWLAGLFTIISAVVAAQSLKITVTEFPLPTSASGPNGIARGPDGALWFAEYAVHKIGRVTTSGSVTEYPVPVLFPGGGPWCIDRKSVV